MSNLVVGASSRRAKKEDGQKVELYTHTETSIPLMEKYGTKAKAIRALAAEGKGAGEIARLLNIRPQHVYNTMHQVLKKK